VPAPPPRFHCPLPLEPGESVSLPMAAARHVQVLRLQPGDVITLFGALDEKSSGGAEALAGGEFAASIQNMGRADVRVLVGQYRAVSREAEVKVHLALGVPAGERMEWMVEKATELGAASIQPLVTQRALLRLDLERARKKARHWRAVAVAACEQCGRNRVPQIHDMLDLVGWLASPAQIGHEGARWLLAPDAPLGSLAQARRLLQGQDLRPVWVLSGPEGGLAALEDEAARRAGFVPIGLGPRILRAETAPLAALVALTLGR
jgi:16S rRNA (uracil1498-N3)-methyltransferase